MIYLATRLGIGFPQYGDHAENETQAKNYSPEPLPESPVTGPMQLSDFTQ